MDKQANVNSGDIDRDARAIAAFIQMTHNRNAQGVETALRDAPTATRLTLLDDARMHQAREAADARLAHLNPEYVAETRANIAKAAENIRAQDAQAYERRDRLKDAADIAQFIQANYPKNEAGVREAFGDLNPALRRVLGDAERMKEIAPAIEARLTNLPAHYVAETRATLATVAGADDAKALTEKAQTMRADAESIAAPRNKDAEAQRVADFIQANYTKTVAGVGEAMKAADDDTRRLLYDEARMKDIEARVDERLTHLNPAYRADTRAAIANQAGYANASEYLDRAAMAHATYEASKPADARRLETDVQTSADFIDNNHAKSREGIAKDLARQRDEVRETLADPIRQAEIAPQVDAKLPHVRPESIAATRDTLATLAKDRGQDQANALEDARAPVRKAENTIDALDPFAGPATASPSDKSKALPEDVAANYRQDGQRFYHAKAPTLVAFEDRGSRLQTTTDSTTVAKTLVDIAETREWSTISVTGSDKFKREVWLEASSRGIDVKGYKPTQDDWESVRARSEARNNGIERVQAQEQGPQRSDNLQRGESAQTQQARPSLARETGDGPKLSESNLADRAALVREKGFAEASKTYPDLAKYAGTEAAAAKVFERSNMTSEQQKVAMDYVRNSMATEIERGETPPIIKVQPPQARAQTGHTHEPQQHQPRGRAR